MQMFTFKEEIEGMKRKREKENGIMKERKIEKEREKEKQNR